MDAKPGLNKMMLDMLERRCQGDPTKYGCVSLMLDAMSIKKHVQYNPHTESMSGFVDMGDGNNENDVASEALVFIPFSSMTPLSLYFRLTWKWKNYMSENPTQSFGRDNIYDII